MSAIAGGAAIGAGVGLSSVALMPFNAANTFLGSAFFGYGMILGERYMYQADWPKIQQRLENGEKIENIIQEYTGTFQAVVMKEAKIIFDSVTREMAEIIKTALFTAPPAPPATDETREVAARRGRTPTKKPKPEAAPQPPPRLVGGVKLPPVAVPQPKPKPEPVKPKLTIPQVYAAAVGRLIYNKGWTVQSKIPNRTPVRFQILRQTIGSLTAAKAFASRFWPTATYTIFNIGGVHWFVPKKSL